MSHEQVPDARSRYRELLRERPSWFANPPGGPRYEILLDDASMDLAERNALQRLRALRPDLQPTRQWTQVGVVLEDGYLLVLRDAVRFPDGWIGTYDRVMNRPERGPGAAVLPELDGQFLLIECQRHALRTYRWEAPRGFSRDGESAEDTAHREIEEEVNGRVLSLTPLGVLHPDGGKLGDGVHLFHARLAAINPSKPEDAAQRGPNEAIRAVRRVGTPELVRMVADGTISDAFTLSLFAKAVVAGIIRVPT